MAAEIPAFSNTAIPNSDAPNNAIYAFWDDLNPSGGANGNVYVKQTSASTYVVEWYHVKRYGSNDTFTFQIVLNGADNTFLMQYQTVPSSSGATVGVENNAGSVATQYAYNSSSAIFGELAIKFTPTTVTVLTIGGTVRDYDGTLVAGATVEVVAGPMTTSGTTNASGVYSLQVTAGTYTVRARQGNLTTSTRMATVPPDQSGVDLTFPQLLTVSGTVRDYDGTALAGVSLSSQPSGAYAQTDTNGHYEMQLPSGIHCVSASKYPRPRGGQAVTVPPSQTTVDFVFPRYYTISGTVRGSDGTALGSVEVRAVGPSTGYDYTGSDGSYELTVLTAGTYVVTAQQNGRLEQARPR